MAGALIRVVFGGLPGTGKTTASRPAAPRMGAVHLRIDASEQAMRAAGIAESGAVGYSAAQALATEKLRLGRAVVADPLRASRQGWRDAARSAGARLLDAEILCFDAAGHRRRVGTRAADLLGHVLPARNQVLQHAYETRDDDRLVLDTGRLSVVEAVELVLRQAAQAGPLRDRPGGA